MAGLLFCAFYLVSLLALPSLSLAEDTVSSVQSDAPLPATRIVTDEENNTVTIFIDGKPVVQINKDGLHVVESINYGGVLTDTGSAYVEKIIAGDGHAE